SLTAALQERARRAGIHAEFTGFVGAARLRDLMADAEVFVSVPSSDAASVAVLQAMAAGCFPVLSDLPTQREWVDDGVNGFLVPVPNWQFLADRIIAALDDAGLRRAAAGRNRAIVEERGLNETQMARMEEIYLRLAGRA
ncbi:MAG TPA: glycosyltransferase, partial [Candidatus Tectomicrobia bacterium]|nr:glycosyltransferase [Candidatus Tectomicrobia bacterium]